MLHLVSLSFSNAQYIQKELTELKHEAVQFGVGFFVLFEVDVFGFFSFLITGHEHKGRGFFDGKIFDKVVM